MLPAHSKERNSNTLIGFYNFSILSLIRDPRRDVCIQFYIKNGPYLSESEKNTYTQLFHRMGRLDNQSNVLREPVENPDAPHLRETLFDESDISVMFNNKKEKYAKD